MIRKKRQRLALALFVLALTVSGAADASKNSCNANPVQLQAQVAKRYAINHIYSLLSQCGLGNLLNFGLGSLGNLLNLKGGCNKPVQMLASQPISKGEEIVSRTYTEGLQRPVNSRVEALRGSVRSGSWYKNQPWYQQ